MKGFMYILQCADGSYYTGSTKDLESRIEQHQNGEAAIYTKKRLPETLVYVEEFDRVDLAFYREKQVQGWSRKKKEALIRGQHQKLPELARNYTEYLASTTKPQKPSVSTTSTTSTSSVTGEDGVAGLRQAQARGTKSKPTELIKKWVDLFNQGKATELADLYHEDAINHQVANEPVVGRKAIQNMFEKDFATAEMMCIVENIFEDGEWAILEWKDPNGLRRYGFFQVLDGKIKFESTPKTKS